MREWYELKFSLEFRDRTGTEFQNLFTTIMNHRHPGDFQTVKPSGAVGDRKCDGYHTSRRRVFQVYAPERLVATKAIKKINEDYAGAEKDWKAFMTEWVFVHNQHRGLHPDVTLVLAGIRTAKRHHVETWCEVELRNEFFALSAPDQARILGAAPTQETLTRLDLQDVVQVARVIAQQEPHSSGPVATVPAGKLEANGLSDYPKSFLQAGSRKAPLIKKLFDEWHDPEFGDRIAAAFRSEYTSLRSKGVFADDLFLALWKFAGGGTYTTAREETAVMALLAFLFEECEIFEPPKIMVLA